MNDDNNRFQRFSGIRDYLIILQKHIWMIVVVVLVFVGLTTLWNLRAIPTYRATAQVLIEPDNPKVVDFEQVVGGDRNTSDRDYHLTQYRLLTSRNILKSVVEELGLEKEEGYGVLRKDDDIDISQKLKVYWSTVSRFLRGLFSKIEDEEAPKDINSLPPRERAIKKILDGIEVSPLGKSRLVLVQYEDRDPELAAKIVNEVVNDFIKMNFEMRFSMTKEAANWLQKEIKKARQDVAKSVNALQKYREKYNIVSLEDRQNIVAQKLVELSSATTRARTERIAMEEVAKKVRDANGSIQALHSLPDVLLNPVIQRLKGELVRLQSEYSDLVKRYKERHPKMARLKSSIRLLEEKMNEEIRRISNNVLTRYSMARARENSLASSLESQKREALKLSRLSIQYKELNQEAETNKKIYNSLLLRTKETGILEGINTTNIRIVDSADVPNRPVRPRKLLNILVSMVASTFFGVVFAFFLERLDESLRSPDDVELITGAPTIGVISELGSKVPRRDPLLQAGEMVHVIGREHFYDLRTMLNFRLGTINKVVQVTSCVPEEGKTFISANLAIAMSKPNKNVLLIEGDLKRPKLVNYFSGLPTQGLADVLLDKIELDDVFYTYPNSTLSILPAGECMGDSSNLLLRPKLAEVVKQLRTRFDIVIVDSPPVFSVSDPLVWARHMDGVLFVVDMQQITETMLRQAMNKLQTIEAPLLGTISNRLTKHGRYYYYGYSNQYSDYYQKSS